jgi:hypothetical protein
MLLSKGRALDGELAPKSRVGENPTRNSLTVPKVLGLSVRFM